MNFEQLENDIASRLAPLATDTIEVVTMPENTKEFNREFDDGRIIVAYREGAWGETKSTQEVNQVATLTFGVVFQARRLRTETGIYQLFNHARKLLIGFKPTSCEALKLKSFELYSDEDDLFTFVAFFECDSYYVEDFTPPVEPLVTQITTDIDTATFYTP